MVNRNNYLHGTAYLDFLEKVCRRRAKSLLRYWGYQKHLLIWADETPLGMANQINPPFQDYLWAKLTYPREYRSLPLAWIEAPQPPAMPERAPGHV